MESSSPIPIAISAAAAASPAGAPDWSSLASELECPLCNYNLRGLAEPRCPECGFAFQWAELLDRNRNRHPYLFEHQERHNIWSFWKTFWRDCRPWRFWRELSPTNPVRVGRLLLFWFLANSLVFGILLAPVPRRLAPLPAEPVLPTAVCAGCERAAV